MTIIGGSDLVNHMISLCKKVMVVDGEVEVKLAVIIILDLEVTPRKTRTVFDRRTTISGHLGTTFLSIRVVPVEDEKVLRISGKRVGSKNSNDLCWQLRNKQVERKRLKCF